jgi:hypothetical protein
MPILELRTAKQTSTKESDEGVTELSSGIDRFPSGGVAPAAFDRLFRAAPRVPILILREADREERAKKIVQRGAQARQIKKQAYGFHFGAGCAR